MDISLNIPSTSLRYGRRFIITSRSCRSFPPSFRLGVNQNIDPSLRLRRGLTNRHRFATGAISSNESLPAASPFLPLRVGGPSAAASSRRPPSLRSGHFPSIGVILSGHRVGRHPPCNPALLQKISLPSSSFPASFLDSCFDFPDSLFLLFLLSFDPMLNLVMCPDSALSRTS